MTAHDRYLKIVSSTTNGHGLSDSLVVVVNSNWYEYLMQMNENYRQSAYKSSVYFLRAEKKEQFMNMNCNPLNKKLPATKIPNKMTIHTVDVRKMIQNNVRDWVIAQELKQCHLLSWIMI